MSAYSVGVGGVALAIVAICAHSISVGAEPIRCEVAAHTQAGAVCGLIRRGVDGKEYASFRGVPYARQPTGELRFQELQPPELWNGFRDATAEGPACPQNDVFYGRLMNPQAVREECIHANVHVPLGALPGGYQRRLARRVVRGPEDHEGPKGEQRGGLPILVFIHGGGFAFGSADADLHGPERLVSEGVIVVTFNYRLNIFGFLSLNSSSVPGNAGLRDMVTLLQWVRNNARGFGGDPGDVAIGGQSAGASAAHLLALSPAAEGLFKRVILMSGTAIPSFYTTSPIYAQFIASQLLTILGISTTNPEEIHQQLIAMPLTKLMAANSKLQDLIGIVVFLPVIESSFKGIKRILDDDTELSLAKGRGKSIPMLVGYTNSECEVFRPRFEELNILKRIEKNPLTILSPNLIFSLPPEVALEQAKKVEERYFNVSPTLDEYVESCSDTYYKYPALKLAEYRHATGGAPIYMYEFSYDADHSVLREGLRINYTGAGHVEDLTFVFQVNSVSVPRSSRDDAVRRLMTKYVTSFIKHSNPTHNEPAAWRPVDSNGIYIRKVLSPSCLHDRQMSPAQCDLLQFFDGLQPPGKLG